MRRSWTAWCKEVTKEDWVADGWRDAEFTLYSALQWRGFSLADAIAWRGAGFEPDEARNWSRLFRPKEARAWREAGYSRSAASRFRLFGNTGLVRHGSPQPDWMRERKNDSRKS